MAIFHFDLGCLQRAAGQSSVRTAAYITGSRLVDERRNRVVNYLRKAAEVLATGPIGPVDWQATERAERRKDARVGRTIILALPWELNLRHLVALVVRFATWLRETVGVALQWAIHGPPGDRRNVHAHILMTTRQVDEHGVQGKKLRDLDSPATSRGIVREWRQKWQDCVNRALWTAGRPERVDCRSHADAGRDQIAQAHVGPQATSWTKKGYRAWALRHNALVNYVRDAKDELARVTRQIRTIRVAARRQRVQAQCRTARMRSCRAKAPSNSAAIPAELPAVQSAALQAVARESSQVTPKSPSRRQH